MPVNERETLADLAVVLSIPVSLFVAMRLGCINHVLLTVEAIINDGLKLEAWIANCIDSDMAALEANIASLQHRIQAPLLCVVPNLGNIKLAAARVEASQRYLDLDALLN